MTPDYPNQERMEVPLLEAIADHGGSIWFSDAGDDLERELADLFGLSDQDRRYASPEINAKGNRKWRNHIQYVRLKLVERGDLDNSIRDRWKITEQGFRRIGVNSRPM